MRESFTENTRAILVTHLFGFPSEVHQINELVQEAEKKFGNKIYVIQDVAHSYGCKIENEYVSQFGDIALYGMNISKIITSVFGGMITTNNKEIEVILRDYKNKNFHTRSLIGGLMKYAYLGAVSIIFNSQVIYSLLNKIERLGLINKFVKYFDEGTIDFPSDWKEIPCTVETSVGATQLSKYELMVENRRSYGNYYEKNICQTDKFYMFKSKHYVTYSHIPLIVPDKKDIMEYCLRRGVQLGEVLEYSIPHMKAYKEKFSTDESKYDNALFYSQHLVNLPVSNIYNKNISKKVVRIINQYINEKSSNNS